MMVVSETYAKFSTTMTRSALEASAESLLDHVERIVKEQYRGRYEQHTFRVHVRIELGTTRVWITVVTALVGILTTYGDIRQSVDYLIKDANFLSSTLLPEMANQLQLGQEQPDYVQKRLGTPGKLSDLFRKVEHGDISAEDATRRAIDLLSRDSGPEAVSEAAEITEKLAVELRDVIRYSSLKQMPRVSQMPSESRQRRPDLPPPELPRRRRTGVIVSRDTSGKVRVKTY